MGTYLHSIQKENASLIADLVVQGIAQVALDLLKLLGMVSERKDVDPEEAELISAAEALLRKG